MDRIPSVIKCLIAINVAAAFMYAVIMTKPMWENKPLFAYNEYLCVIDTDIQGLSRHTEWDPSHMVFDYYLILKAGGHMWVEEYKLESCVEY